jgi:hypothetical protein
MLGFSFFAYAESAPTAPAGGPPVEVEITAEPDIELDVGDGDLLTES